MQYIFEFHVKDFSITAGKHRFKRDVWIVSKVSISNLDAVRFRQDWFNKISTLLINLENLIVFSLVAYRFPKILLLRRQMLREAT